MKTYSLYMLTDDGFPYFRIFGGVDKNTMKLYLRLTADKFSIDPIESYKEFLEFIRKKKIIVIDDETGERIDPDEFLGR